MSPVLSGNLLLIVNIFDAITDPATGVLSDKTSTRWGRRRPWMAVAVPLMAVSYMLQWQVFPALESDPATADLKKMAYYLPIICLGRLAGTMWSIPHAALVMDMSESEDDRVRLTLLRIASGFLALIVGLVVVGVILGFYDESVRDQVIQAYALSSYVLGALIVVLGVVSLVFVFEKPLDTVAAFGSDRIGFFKGLSIACRNRAYTMLMIAACGCYASLSLVQNNLLMYAEICLQIDDFTPVLVVLIVATILFMVVTNCLISKKGKKFAFFTGVVGLCVTYLILYLHPPNVLPLAYTMAVIAGFGLSTISFVPMVMLPDVIDVDELQTGERREGMFYSYAVFIEKVATGVTLAVSNYALGIAGYDPALETQPEAVDVTLRVLMSFVPAGLTFFASVLIFFYPLTEKSREETTLLLVGTREERVFSNKAFTFFKSNSKADSSRYAMLERGEETMEDADDPKDV